jgi:hypothetical protein
MPLAAPVTTATLPAAKAAGRAGWFDIWRRYHVPASCPLEVAVAKTWRTAADPG